jgi:transcriptional regulator with XRE-family HTH domain
MTIMDYLEAKGLTRSQFAKMIGVDVVSVTRYINGDRTPRRRHLDRIAKVTKGAVTANDILQHEVAACFVRAVTR